MESTCESYGAEYMGEKKKKNIHHYSSTCIHPIDTELGKSVPASTSEA